MRLQIFPLEIYLLMTVAFKNHFITTGRQRFHDSGGKLSINLTMQLHLFLYACSYLFALF